MATLLFNTPVHLVLIVLGNWGFDISSRTTKKKNFNYFKCPRGHDDPTTTWSICVPWLIFTLSKW